MIQDNLEEQVLFNSNTVPSSMAGDIAKYSFNKWLNTDDDLLFTLEVVLRGYEIIPQTSSNGEVNGYIVNKDNAKAKMNEKGVRDILQFVRMNLNKNVRMSNVNGAEVYRDVLTVCLNFNMFVAENYDKWEMDLFFWDELITIVSYAIWFSFNRPKDEGERKQIGRTYTETKVSQTVESKNQKDGGLLGRVF